jgi:hypothetical protein
MKNLNKNRGGKREKEVAAIAKTKLEVQLSSQNDFGICHQISSH